VSVEASVFALDIRLKAGTQQMPQPHPSSRSTGRLESIGQGFALLLASLVVCFLVGEAAVRAFYPQFADYNMEMWRYATRIKVRGSDAALPFVHGANRSGDFYGAEIRTNSFGFRDGEYPVERVPGRRRILFVGDSFTLGWGVAQDSTMAELVEQKLNAGGQPTEVINLGIGNYNTAMELELFRRSGLQFQPDMVVLLQFVNDAEPTPRPAGGIKGLVLSNSYLIALLMDRFIALRPLVAEGADWKTYYSNLYRHGAPGLLASEEAFSELIELCRERGIQLVIASIPELRQLVDYPFPQATEFVRSIAERNAVPFLDLLPALEREDPASLWVSVEDSHANARANGIMADALYEKIRSVDGTGGAPPLPADSAGAARPQQP
jgi:lysophospholipase L1-like esterase